MCTGSLQTTDDHTWPGRAWPACVSVSRRPAGHLLGSPVVPTFNTYEFQTIEPGVVSQENFIHFYSAVSPI